MGIALGLAVGTAVWAASGLSGAAEPQGEQLAQPPVDSVTAPAAHQEDTDPSQREPFVSVVRAVPPEFDRSRNTFEIVRATMDDLPDWIFDLIDPQPVGTGFSTLGLQINDYGQIAMMVGITDGRTQDQWGFVARYDMKSRVFDFVDTSAMGRLRINFNMGMNNHGDILFGDELTLPETNWVALRNGRLVQLPRELFGGPTVYCGISDDLWVDVDGLAFLHPIHGRVLMPPPLLAGCLNANSLALGTAGTIPENLVIWHPSTGAIVLDGIGIPDLINTGLNDFGDILARDDELQIILKRTPTGYEFAHRVVTSNTFAGNIVMNNDLWVAFGLRQKKFSPALWTPETGTFELRDLLLDVRADLQLFAPDDISNKGEIICEVAWYEGEAWANGTFIATIRDLPPPTFEGPGQ